MIKASRFTVHSPVQIRPNRVLTPIRADQATELKRIDSRISLTVGDGSARVYLSGVPRFSGVGVLIPMGGTGLRYSGTPVFQSSSLVTNRGSELPPQESTGTPVPLFGIDRVCLMRPRSVKLSSHSGPRPTLAVCCPRSDPTRPTRPCSRLPADEPIREFFQCDESNRI